MGSDAVMLAVLAEACPTCRSEDVRAVEPGFFALDLDRAELLRSRWVEGVEFSCRACGTVWH